MKYIFDDILSDKVSFDYAKEFLDCMNIVHQQAEFSNDFERILNEFVKNNSYARLCTSKSDKELMDFFKTNEKCLKMFVEEVQKQPNIFNVNLNKEIKSFPTKDDESNFLVYQEFFKSVLTYKKALNVVQSSNFGDLKTNISIYDRESDFELNKGLENVAELG